MSAQSVIDRLGLIAYLGVMYGRRLDLELVSHALNGWLLEPPRLRIVPAEPAPRPLVPDGEEVEVDAA